MSLKGELLRFPLRVLTFCCGAYTPTKTFRVSLKGILLGYPLFSLTEGNCGERISIRE